MRDGQSRRDVLLPGVRCGVAGCEQRANAKEPLAFVFAGLVQLVVDERGRHRQHVQRRLHGVVDWLGRRVGRRPSSADSSGIHVPGQSIRRPDTRERLLDKGADDAPITRSDHRQLQRPTDGSSDSGAEQTHRETNRCCVLLGRDRVLECVPGGRFVSTSSSPTSLERRRTGQEFTCTPLPAAGPSLLRLQNTKTLETLAVFAIVLFPARFRAVGQYSAVRKRHSESAGIS